MPGVSIGSSFLVINMSFDKYYSWRWVLVDQWKYKFLFRVRQLDTLIDKYLGK